MKFLGKIEPNIKFTSGELVTNGTFDTDATGWDAWSMGSTTNWSGGTIFVSAPDEVFTSFETVYGKYYLLKFTLIDVINDQVWLYFDNNTSQSTDVDFYNGSGTHNFLFLSDYTGTETIYFGNWNYTAGSSWRIDNVSIVETELPKSTLDITDYTGESIIDLGNDYKNNIRIGRSKFIYEPVNETVRNNIVVGHQSYLDAINGRDVIIVGNNSGNGAGSQANDYENIIIGNNTNIWSGSYLISIGHNSFSPIINGTVQGQSNISVGNWNFLKNTYGDNNVALGNYILQDNKTGGQNVAVGHYILTNNVSGENNVGIGSGVLYQNTSGNSNTAVGGNSLSMNVTGSTNSAFGGDALRFSRGNGNTAVGFGAVYLNPNGNYNTGVGSFSFMDFVFNCNYNTGVGYKAGLGIMTGTSNTIIGARVSGLTSILHNNIIIANGTGGTASIKLRNTGVLWNVRDRMDYVVDYSSTYNKRTIVDKGYITGNTHTDLKPIITITATTTLNSSHHTVLCNTTSGSITVNLPAVSSNSGRIYNIKLISATNQVNINPNGSENIDGSSSDLVINTQWQSKTIHCDGAAWYVI